MMTVPEILQKKRDGLENSPQEIRCLVEGAVAGDIPDYQIAAWLMAAFIRGLNQVETMTLTRAFVDSGRRLSFSSAEPPRVDKHSTGGVGDKTSLVIAPLVAAAGLYVPMISGRGLGFTGGTLDKMESIPGYQTSLSLERLQAQVRQIGVGLVGATRELAPGDQIFYRIRDVTGTVESLPLIVASILSKKSAEDLRALVLDVKTGNGAVMKSLEDSERLARALVDTGQRLGMQVVALLTDMSQPLGYAIGNALEVVEALETLQGGGPSDFRTLCLELAGRMLAMAGTAPDPLSGVAAAERLLASGRPAEVFQRLVAAQGGDATALENPRKLLGNPRETVVPAPRSGYLQGVRSDLLGRAALRLGAGRSKASDSIDPQAGIQLHFKVGSSVKMGEPLATLYYNRQSAFEEARELVTAAFTIDTAPAEQPILIQKVVE